MRHSSIATVILILSTFFLCRVSLSAESSFLSFPQTAVEHHALDGSVTPQMFLNGKAPATVLDWKPFIQDAINFVESRGGGTVFIPPRDTPYPIGGTITVERDGVVIKGAGRSSILMDNNAPDNLIVFKNCSTCGVQNLQISGNVSYNSVLSARQEPYAIVLGRGTNSAFVKTVYIQGMWNGIHIYESDGEDQVSSHVVMSNMVGHYGIRFEGSKEHPSYRAMIDNFTGGNVPTDIFHADSRAGARWKAHAHFEQGDVVEVKDGGIWIAQSDGVSGNVEPAGIPGNGATIFSTLISDGSIQWKYSSGAMTWVSFTSYAYSLVIRNAALLGGVHGVTMDRAADSNAGTPKWLFATDVEGDHNFKASWDIEAGEAAKCNMCWFGSLTDYGAIYSEDTTEGSISNSRLAYNGGGGIRVKGGNNHDFSHNQIGQNCGFAETQGDHFCSGIVIDKPVQTTIISDNIVGALGNPTGQGNFQDYGILVIGHVVNSTIRLNGNIATGNITRGVKYN